MHAGFEKLDRLCDKLRQGVPAAFIAGRDDFNDRDDLVIGRMTDGDRAGFAGVLVNFRLGVELNLRGFFSDCNRRRCSADA